MKRLVILFLVFSGIISCKKDENITPKQEVLTKFEVQLNKSNSLRAEVSANFSKKTSYYIEYWQTADKSTSKKTQTYTGNGVVKKNLILLNSKTEYSCRIGYGDGKFSEVKKFTTKDIPLSIPYSDLLVDEINEDFSGYLLSYVRKSPGVIYLMNTKGDVLWYEPVNEGVVVANFDNKTNRLYMLTEPKSSINKFPVCGKNVKVIDLFGNTILSKVLETVPEMINRQAHHECRPLPDGNVLLVTYVDKTFDLSSQGGTQNENVKGDGYIVMNLEGKVIDSWDCFQTVNPIDDPKIMEVKNDWLHANSINYDSDGNYYMTFNRPSELWKINTQTGKVMYRLGKNGDVNVPKEGYANGMHCANPQAPNEILILDNARNKNSGTRAILYKVNEDTKTANLLLNCEIPKEYSSPNRSNTQQIASDMLLFASSVKNLILFTDRSPKVKIFRAITLSNTFYRVEYIPSISY